MTHAAQRIITPLAVRWASQADIITDWDGDLTALNEADAVLVAPATGHHGQPSPRASTRTAHDGLVRRARKTLLMMVLSMHEDLAADPITMILSTNFACKAFTPWGPQEEGKRKTPAVERMVAELAHDQRPVENRKTRVITLGATRSAIDDVRHVQNTSSGCWAGPSSSLPPGLTWTCVAGITTQVAQRGCHWC